MRILKILENKLIYNNRREEKNEERHWCNGNVETFNERKCREIWKLIAPVYQYFFPGRVILNWSIVMQC
jgi:hypothetical protein